MNSKHLLMAASLCVGITIPTLAMAQSSVGTYSGCKKLKGAAAKSCLKCVEGGNFYQTKSKSCGMAPGMKKSQSAAKEKGPTRPSKMPKTNEYVTIPAGTFKIGPPESEQGRASHETQANVTITRAFMMKKTEVTYGEWHFIMGAVTSYYDKACGDDCPVGGVGWRESLEYLNALSKKEGLKPCYNLEQKFATWSGLDCEGYRLPTEAEWEYAARAGSSELRYGELAEIGWSYDNSDSSAHPVGKKKPNAFGLYDMLGNHYEWTWDLYEYGFFEGDMTDPIAGGLAQKEEAENHIMRGGSHRDNWTTMRAGHRFYYPANGGSTNHGFRPVRTVAAKK
jgi:formylglycine-generating enzyme required for sulfatase activity